MSTKRQIAEQAQRIITGGNLRSDEPLNIRELMRVLDQLRDEMVKYSFFETVKSTNEYYLEPDYLSYYDNGGVGYTLSGSDDSQYVALPASVITLPHEMGIYVISPIDNQENPFIRIPPGALGLFRGSQALEHELNTYYWNIKDTVYFKNLDPSVTEVMFILAASSASIAPDESYPVSPDDENKLRDMLVERFLPMKQIPQDETENYQKNS